MRLNLSCLKQFHKDYFVSAISLSLITSAMGSALFSPSAQASTADDFMKNLSGCFKVTFRYVEDGKNDQTIENLHEWITPLKDGPQTSLQHYGVVGSQAFKHWREEWQEVSEGVWKQTVAGPSGSVRYTCTAPMVFNQWRCAVAKAPKPRRDQHRTDYETLDRENTLQVTPLGWVQSENNIKRDKSGKAVSNELGWNEYKRVEDTFCQAAKDLPSGD